MAASVSAATANRFPNQLLPWIRCVQPLDRWRLSVPLCDGPTVWCPRHAPRCGVAAEFRECQKNLSLVFIERHVSDPFTVVEHPMAPGILGFIGCSTTVKGSET